MADFKEYKGVWVFCEQRQGALMSTDFELVSEARKLADELGCEVTGLLLGDNVEPIAKELGGYGADKVLVCESPLLKDYTTDAYAKVVCDMVNEYKPEVLLIGATNIGRDLGPRCAARLHTGLTADATHLDIDTKKYVDFLAESSTIDLSKQTFDYEDRNLKMTRPAFGGHLMATIICPRFRPQMSTVRPGVMKKAPFDQAKADACQIVKPAFSLTADDIKTEVLSVEKAATKLVDLIGADVIVSVGRGISKYVEKGIALAEQLAAALGNGVVGASRAVTRCRLDDRRPPGGSDRQDRPPQDLCGSGHLRRHPARGRYAGLRAHHCREQERDCPHLRRRGLRHRGRPVQGRARADQGDRGRQGCQVTAKQNCFTAKTRDSARKIQSVCAPRFGGALFCVLTGRGLCAMLYLTIRLNV